MVQNNKVGSATSVQKICLLAAVVVMNCIGPLELTNYNAINAGCSVARVS